MTEPTTGTTAPPPEAPARFRIQECTRQSQARPLQDDVAGWLREMTPLLGCPMSALDDALWGFEGHVWVPLPGTDGRAVSTRASDEAPGLNVFVLPQEEEAHTLYRVLKLDASADPGAEFQTLLASLREALGTAPIEESDEFADFPASAERPFRVRLSIDGRDVALVVDR